MQTIATAHSYLWTQSATPGYAAPTRESIAFLKQVGAWAEPADAVAATSLLSPPPPSVAPAHLANGSLAQRPFAAVFADALGSL